MEAKKRSKVTLAIVIGVAVIGIVLAILCYSDAVRIREGTVVAKVTLRLNWIPDPTFTGAYIAKARGFWERRGVEVSIKSGGMNNDPVRLVSEGTDQFGVVGANRLIQARAQGIPVIAICAEMQTHRVGWIVRDTSGIKSFSDFKGRRIGLKVGDESETIMRAVLTKVGLKEDDVTMVPVGFSPDPFVSGQVDALPVYINEEPHTVASKGVPVRVLTPSTEGISLYGNVIITSPKMIEQNRELVEKFVAGLLDGWNAARTSTPQAIARELVKVEPQMSEVPTENVLSSTLDLVYGSLERRDCKLGWMDLTGWQNSVNILRKYADINLGENTAAVFTNSFVEWYYANGAGGDK